MVKNLSRPTNLEKIKWLKQKTDACIVSNGDQLLVIKDKFSSGYKLSRGHIDNNETINGALIKGSLCGNLIRFK